MEWLTVNPVTTRFTVSKRYPDHKVVTIESIINRVCGAEVTACGARFVDGRVVGRRRWKRNFRIAEKFNSP